MQEHNREIMVYSCGGRCRTPAISGITRTQDYSPEIALSSSRGAVFNVSTYAFTTTLNHCRNCCYVSQHYSSHLRLARQQDVDHLLGGYNRKGHLTEDRSDCLG
ncbi:hypothetical protein PQZ65_gp86 [Klebsiella phage 1611E-K2-1]|uniref:hypothetical protein n=1 Tax=Klebsiella phage 1611E-K2-1 TaxID=2047786 RepID=UPI00233E5B44|nr:hypothetical protein PQZ65_gp86 [Klebsiella phage 1611E-K2-1]